MSSLTCTKLTIFTIAAILTQIIGLSLFVLGVFPVKSALSGISGAESFYSPCESVRFSNFTVRPPDELKSSYQELSQIPPSLDRLIVMVIDGLPAEFILGKNNKPPPSSSMEAMPYTQSLLAEKFAVGYHSKAAPPTVTMPRLKAMVSGSIGGFLDVAFNFNTQALIDDNLIGQFLSIGWKMVMHGDETWIKLFPGIFSRHDGVSSFFVKDTVQVDYNVTRHLEDELGRTDWNLLILHYLGLDHVGHTGGRNSVLMKPKLKEIDDVIKKIHSSIIQDKNHPTLLVIVSDHGMTENGNHGGSSFEETDSLLLFINPINKVHESPSIDTVSQVDIAPTLALLFGIPIPKNNAGIVIAQTLNYLTDEQQLRAMELNSWQIFRLLQAQLPHLSCHINFSNQDSGTSTCNGNDEEIFSCLYINATNLHKAWRFKKTSRSNSREEYAKTLSAYNEFLSRASDWLSRRATDKPFYLLAYGVTTMLLSCLLFLSLLFKLGQDIYQEENDRLSKVYNKLHGYPLDEIAIFAIISTVILSMGSSSLVEEEQYIWFFLTSTFYLVLLRKTIQELGQNKRSCKSLTCITIILICGRILRGWHQGGVNWTNIPDISKWIEKSGSVLTKSCQLASGVLVVVLSLYTLFLSQLKRNVTMVISVIFLLPVFLVLKYIVEYQESGFGDTQLAQVSFTVLGNFVMGIVLFLPWVIQAERSTSCLITNMIEAISGCTFLIGWGYLFGWCLLQLILQQPINSIPFFLILVQLLASVCFCSYAGQHSKQWVEKNIARELGNLTAKWREYLAVWSGVSALYFLGMAGHFGLGNTNTLATIDVAGAFIGVSSHSTLLSGILMFIITYASPILSLICILMYISVKAKSSDYLHKKDANFGDILKFTLGFPCLVPLALNSVLLIAYTVVLLLMRNHLFIWSVFSPKYLYVCAASACVCIGVCIVYSTVLYTSLVLSFRMRKLSESNISN